MRNIILLLRRPFKQTEIANGQDQTVQQLSQAETDRFLMAAEVLHKSIVKPLLSPVSEHYRALQNTHEALLKTVKDITGKDAPFIRWHGTGPVHPSVTKPEH